MNYDPDFTIEHRETPSSSDAERSVIGSLMINNHAWDGISELVAMDDFFYPAYRAIFKAISNLADAGTPFDLVTIADMLAEAGSLDAAGGLPELIDIQKNTPSSANIRSYAKIVAEKSMERQLLSVADEVSNEVYDGKGTVAEKITNAQSLILSLEPDRKSGGPVSINESLKQTIENIDQRFNHSGTILGIETGFTELDDMFCGLRDSDLVLVAGRPSMGKTTLAMNIAEHNALKCKKNVLVFSLEMSSDSLTERMISSSSSIPFKRIRTGGLEETDWSRLSSAVGGIKDAPLYIDDSAGLHINQIRARARKHARLHGCDLIVVDYLQLIRGDGQGRTEDTTNISIGLKAMAKEIGVPVIALSQLNRSLESRPNKRPINSDLRDSGSLEQDADLILFVYRDEVYNEDSPDKGLAEMIVRKFRNGEIGTKLLESRLEFCRFDNLTSHRSAVSQNETKKKGFEYKGAK